MGAGWRQAGSRLEAGWRLAGGRLEAGWRPPCSEAVEEAAAEEPRSAVVERASTIG